MTIAELLGAAQGAQVVGSTTTKIDALSYDSRAISHGTMFFALRGTARDGHDYIDMAVGGGASAIVCEVMPEQMALNTTYIVVEDSTIAMGRIAAMFYGNPSEKIKLVGVTGTNGKTTTATLLFDLFRTLGYKAGLISTVVYRIEDRSIESTHTTPDAIRLNAMLAQMVACGCEYCFMEVSSHSIVQHRIEALQFCGAIFTNITHDHLDYHKTFAEYIRAKKMLFDSLPQRAFALVNADDKNGMVMVQNTKADVKTFSLRSMADFRCKIVEMHFDGMLLDVDESQVWVRFLGRFNAYNILGVYAAAILLGAEREEVLQALSSLHSVSGRFEYLTSESGITAIVDYAHTPDALKNVIDTINEILPPERQLITVVGCGGDRDATKRPEMAHIAASNSNLAIFTSDNPRTENPEDILAQMQAGVVAGDRYITIADRREAIKAALMMAHAGDIVLVAGKGHENYQIVGTVKHHFDDKEEIAKVFGGTASL